MAERTLYIILRREDATETTWREDGPHQSAHSAEQAIRQAAELRAENDLDAAGIYAAVPSRSFKPTVVSAAVHTTIKIGATA